MEVVQALEPFFRDVPPPLDEVLGATCEMYRVGPQEVDRPRSQMARKMYCYIALKWSRKPLGEIGRPVSMHYTGVGKAAVWMEEWLRVSELARADLNLISVRIAERMMVLEKLECQ